MIAATSQPAVAKKGRLWIGVACLVPLVLIGGLLRIHGISRENLWFDEYWTLYLATGRGNEIFTAPNQIMVHPPDVSFSTAPAWWHIWNRLKGTSHPPLYHILLRWWVDLFGDRDGPVRGLSVVFSLGGVILMYIAARKFSGSEVQGVIAAALMALAPIQIYYSQQVRPYTMMQFIALAGAIAMISIEIRGWSWLKLIALALAVLALALTHYFTAGVIAAFAVYALVRFRGGARVGAVCAIVLAALLAAALWSRHLGDDSVAGYGMMPSRNLLHMLLSVPQRLTLETDHDPMVMADNGPWILVIAIAVVTYLVPVITLRQRPELLLWWLWTILSVGLILGFDLARHSALLSITRYLMPAAPGVYAILATPLLGRGGRLAPWAILAGVLVYAIDYSQMGPPNSPNVQTISRMVKEQAASGDVVVVVGDFYDVGYQAAPTTYFVMTHYSGPWTVPVVLANGKIGEPVQAQLLKFHRVWVIGLSPEISTRKILPGWKIHDVRGSGDGDVLWYVTPPAK
jgi:hypothetical protein